MKNKLYYIRTEKELTLKALSELYFFRYKKRLSPSQLGKIEGGTTNTSLDVFLELSDLLGVTLDFMLDRADSAAEEVRMHKKGFKDPGDKQA